MRLFLLCCLLLMTVPTSAQSLWSTLPPGWATRADLYQPSGDAFTAYEDDTAALFLFGQARLFDDVSLRVEVPLAWGGLPGEHRAVLGNVYLGVTYPPPGTPGVTAEIGVRLPTAGGEGLAARQAGRFSDVSRGRPFAPHTLTLTAATTYEKSLLPYLQGRVRGRPMLFLDTSGDTNMVLQFVHLVQLVYTLERLHADVGIGGTFVASDVEGDDFRSRFSYEVGFGLAVPLPYVTPTVSVRVPLDDLLRERLDMVYGAGIVVYL